MKKLNWFTTAAIMFSSLSSFAEGGHGGNGGDHVRATFLRVGQQVIKYLEETQQGQALVSQNRLSIGNLKATLDTRRIEVSATTLTDNTGSRVDALGVPGKITLNRGSMIEHFENNRDVGYLVFHEMLRSAGVNDDGYPISKALNPFPSQYKIRTRLLELEQLVADDQLKNWVQLGAPVTGGSGCVNSAAKVELNDLNNTLDLIFDNFDLKNTDGRTLDRKSCNLAIPFRLAPNKRLVIHMTDVTTSMVLKSGSRLTLHTEHFAAGTQGKRDTKTYLASSRDKRGRGQMRISSVFTTGCGVSGNLRLNFSATLNGANSSAVVKHITQSIAVENCN